MTDTPTVERFDAATPRGKARKDQWGNFHVPALFVSEGVYKYRRHDGGIVREYKPAEEIYAQAFIDSLCSATLTDGHPSLAVTPSNADEYDCGHVKETVRQDSDGLVGEVVAKKTGLITKISSGVATQVSVGLNCVMDNTPGVWVDPQGKEHPYDCIQRAMTANHVAVVKNARVKDARLRLDAAEMIIEDEEKEETMPTQNLMRLDVGDGDSVEVATDVGPILKTYHAKLISAGRELREENTGLKTKLDSSEAKAKELESKLEKIKSVDIDALVALRTETLAGARALMKSDAVDALVKAKKSNVEIRVAACLDSGEDVKDSDASYVRATFDQLIKRKAQSSKNDQAESTANIANQPPSTGGTTTAQRFDEAMKELHGSRKAAS